MRLGAASLHSRSDTTRQAEDHQDDLRHRPRYYLGLVTIRIILVVNVLNGLMTLCIVTFSYPVVAYHSRLQL